MKTRLSIAFTLFLMFFSGTGFAQNVQQAFPEAETMRMNSVSSLPSFVKFKQGQEIKSDSFKSWLAKRFNLNKDYSINLLKQETDNMGYTHFRYEQTYKNIPVYSSMYVLHGKNQKIESFNGEFHNAVNVSVTPSLNESDALKAALNHINATEYKWQSAKEESALKKETKNPAATYYPKGKLMIVPVKSANKTTFYLAYKFDIYASKPVKREYVFVDAHTGKIIKTLNRIHNDVTGTAKTKYSGTRSIRTNKINNTYRLIETTRGGGIETYDMQTGTSYDRAVDFEDADNYWNNINTEQDEAATDAHWGAEKTYDFYLSKFGRNSIDNNGFPIISYVHYGVDEINAAWDGQRITYGDGNSAFGVSPLTTLDIVGHEITHGLTEKTAGLEYRSESGALNESFSDIFGIAIDYYANPATANWLLGDGTGKTFRSMSNPNLYNCPDTYKGDFWDYDEEVHTNSGVQNFWFYLLCMGDTGTNDLSNAYSVARIGMTKATAIAYRTLVYYLTPLSNHADARTYSIQAAADLYGKCSKEVQTVTNAWYAVGVGNEFSASSPKSYFTTSLDSFCTFSKPVTFQNGSTNAVIYRWNFGDGKTDSVANPVHSYTADGDYTVSLKVYSCSGDSDFFSKNIHIGTDVLCTYFMPLSGTTIVNNCKGILWDNGGNMPYSASVSGIFTITPGSGDYISLNFEEFDFDTDSSDELYIYDGPDINSNVIKQFKGNIQPDKTIYTTGNAVTIRIITDDFVGNHPGFKLKWNCETFTKPIVNFNADTTNSCNGVINFTNISSFPASYVWDFGDGKTDSVQNPKHTYKKSGTYTVKLTVQNKAGVDSLVKASYIVVSRFAGPTVNPAKGCPNNSLILTASGTGALSWYDQETGGARLATGDTFVTPVLSSTTKYYVEQTSVPSHTGAKDTSIGKGGYLSNAMKYLIFNCFKPVSLSSVVVYYYADPFSDNSRTFYLLDSNQNVLQEKTVFLTKGKNKVNLNFDVPVANNLILSSNGQGALYRNISGVKYPYTLQGVLSITGSSGLASQYYYFYDWEIVTDNCSSERTVVEAVIDNNTQLAYITPGSSTVFCQGDSVVLTANAGSSYSWVTGDTTQSITVKDQGNYSVTVVTSCGSNYSDPIYVMVNPLPDANAGQDKNICQGQNVTFTANGGNGYLWNNGATTQSITVTPSVSQSYTVTVTDSNGCKATDSVSTVVFSLPAAVINASDTTVFCDGNSVTLTASNASSYKWSNGTVAQSLPVKKSGNYSVTVIDANGCSNTSAVATVTVNPLPKPVVTASAATTFCDGDSVVLSTGSMTSYNWSTGETSQNIIVKSTGDYLVTVTDSNGCSAASSVKKVIVKPLPVLFTSATGPTIFCDGGSVIINANSASSYLWSNGATTQSIKVKTSGNYSVTATGANGCNVTASPIAVTVNPLPAPVIMASGNTTFCQGDSITLSVGNIAMYQWNTGATAQNIVVKTGGNYSVTVTDSNSCSNTASLKVKVNPLPVATIASKGKIMICQGDSVVLTASSASAYLWSDGSTASTVVTKASGNYSVTVTDSNGCSSVSAVTKVVVNPLPKVTITVPLGRDTITFCANDSVQITSSSASSYLWNTGATSKSIVAYTAGKYSVTATDANGCSASSGIITAVVNALPKVSVTSAKGGDTTAVCKGDSVTLTASGANIFLWNTGATSKSIVAYTAGKYSVAATDLNGCSDVSSPVTVLVNALPVVTIIASDTISFCEGDSVKLTASSGSAYLWSDSSSSASVTVKKSGNYSVKVTDKNGCSDTSSVTKVTVKPSVPIADFDASPKSGSAPLLVDFTDKSINAVSWEWTFYGAEPQTSAVRNPKGIQYNSGGSYSVMLRVYGCSGRTVSKLQTQYISVLTGVEEIDSKTGFTVFPNPASENFVVSLNLQQSENINIKVFNVLGETVFSSADKKVVGKYTKEIHLNQPAGVYFVQVHVGETVFSKKVVVSGE